MRERMAMLAMKGVSLHLATATSALCSGYLDRWYQQTDRVEKDAIASLLSKLNSS